MDPDACHGKGMCRLRLVDVRNRDALRRKGKKVIDSNKNMTLYTKDNNTMKWGSSNNQRKLKSFPSRRVYLLFWIKQVEELHDRQEVSQGVFLNAP